MANFNALLAAAATKALAAAKAASDAAKGVVVIKTKEEGGALKVVEDTKSVLDTANAGTDEPAKTKAQQDVTAADDAEKITKKALDEAVADASTKAEAEKVAADGEIRAQ